MSDEKSYWTSEESPLVIERLSKYQVMDGVIIPKSHPRLNVPISSAGSQYAKRSRLGGQRLYLTYDKGKWWLCFPFSDLHARFIYNSDSDAHAEANFHRLKYGTAPSDFLPPAEVLNMLFSYENTDNSIEVFDTQFNGKRKYGKYDFIADMLRGPARNLIANDSFDCPNYLRPFVTALGVDPFALDALPSSVGENLIFALNRPWPVWINPTNFLGVTLFVPAAGAETVGMPETGLSRGELRKGACSYAATREQIVDTKKLFIADILYRGLYDFDSLKNICLGDQDKIENKPFHDMLIPYISMSGKSKYPETISSNVFVVIEEEGKKILLTPPADRGNYPGITRFFVLKFVNEHLGAHGLVARIAEGPLTRELLESKKIVEMFRVGSASGINFVNALVWFDQKDGKYIRKKISDEPGAITSTVSEVFESVVRGYELFFDSAVNGPVVASQTLSRFSKMCIRLEIPEEKVESALAIFNPPSVQNRFTKEQVLEGISEISGKMERRYLRRGGFVGTAHNMEAMKHLARNRY